MPLIDRVYSLGLLIDTEPPTPKTPKIMPNVRPKPAEKAPGDASPSAVEGSSTSTEEADLTSDCETLSSVDSDSACDSIHDSEDDDSDWAVKTPKRIDHVAEQGRAEKCRRQSRSSGRFHELKQAAVDEDASAGFRLCGFSNGKRVYRLESPYTKKLRDSTVRTAVGLCYMNLAAVCPPAVVEVPSSEDDKVKHVNGAFAIRPSALGGLGAFALRDLARGEHILVERPLLRTDCFHLCAELERLSAPQRAAFYALAGHHPDTRASAAERIWTANTFMAGTLEGVFLLASRFNHACPPLNNVLYRYDRRRDVLVMTVARRIESGTELLISYGKTPAMLFQRFGFRCTCGACSGFSEEMAARYWDMRWARPHQRSFSHTHRRIGSAPSERHVQIAKTFVAHARHVMVCPIRTLQAGLALVAAAAAGANLSLSAFLVPRLLESPPAAMLRQWRRMYESGRLASVTTSALFSAAQVAVYLVRWHAAAAGTSSGSGRPSRLPLLAAGLATAVMPYTLTAMQRTNRALLARSAKAEAQTQTTDETVYTAQEIASSRYLVDHWGVLNLVRSALWSAAATVGIAAVL
ncbi:duf1772 domain containing protein [Grosmannia clavigera kw1407]|uniref:Duf1772 domain containing protein n=1 Tax=Grosmannia clavigera (strain kw1407 / UAMH 11150) TaxID=655863 RepID=F0XDH5_GROCL|nr:duf1772 domain containing protein [Grosmannia clavigera kw1407]EFX04361.1 duf1772 domain containing protein [Grosmannia clavigera kw1407]